MTGKARKRRSARGGKAEKKERNKNGLDAHAAAFYKRVLRKLIKNDVEFLVGGGYAFHRYTGIERHTRDFDIFLRERDCHLVLRLLDDGTCRTELAFPHWLAKAHFQDLYIDIIFSSGNGIATVDDEWFEHAAAETVLGIAVMLTPAEEMIWSKAYIMERERYDGADVAHLIRACADRLDWDRLLRRFGAHWRVLLSHLVLFGFIYPGQKRLIPDRVMDELLQRAAIELSEKPVPPPLARVCHGTLLSREQYLPDLNMWGLKDARLEPHGFMTPAETAYWTAAIHHK